MSGLITKNNSSWVALIPHAARKVSSAVVQVPLPTVPHNVNDDAHNHRL
jgi:hypothetical protein